jgi:hypothetical protein
MNFRNLATGAALALALALQSSPAAHANVILTYTGNNFTSFISPYTGTDKVTASITLAAPLGDNLSLGPVTPIAFSLSDGVQTITNQTPGLIDQTFSFATDAMGNISDWFVDVDFSSPTGTGDIVTGGPTRPLDTAGITNASGNADASNSGMPGTWPGTTSAVPEPSTVTVLGAGLLGLGLLRWRRRQNRDLAR